MASPHSLEDEIAVPLNKHLVPDPAAILELPDKSGLSDKNLKHGAEVLAPPPALLLPSCPVLRNEALPF